MVSYQSPRSQNVGSESCASATDPRDTRSEHQIGRLDCSVVASHILVYSAATFTMHYVWVSDVLGSRLLIKILPLFHISASSVS